jgi:hypothetical protein
MPPLIKKMDEEVAALGRSTSARNLASGAVQELDTKKARSAAS